jgi:hypothetical protein
MDQQDEHRIEKNIADGFSELLKRIAATLTSRRTDTDEKIEVAFNTWQAGHLNLTISLLLDVVITLRAKQKFV